MVTVTFRDETATGKSLGTFEVPGVENRVTVRELVRLRVREEVDTTRRPPNTSRT